MVPIERLCIHQVCVMTAWTLPEFVRGLARHGVPALAVWREKLGQCGLAEARRVLDGEGRRVTSLCAAGFFSSPDEAEAAAALDDTRRALDEAASIGAKNLMLVVGGIDPRDKDVARTRARALERAARLVDHARKVGVMLALEPLHPMICATRSVVSTLEMANDWCDRLAAEDVVGIAVDTYATWWDPHLAAGLARAGKRIIAYHLNDWLPVTRDTRLDRGMPGDGLIDLDGFSRLVEATGFSGFHEVEVFSELDWWKRDPDEVIATIKQRCVTAR